MSPQDKAWEQIWDLKRRFEKDYPPNQYGQYLCGVSKVYLQNPAEAEEESGDYCIIIHLESPLPANLNFPDKYQETKIFVKIGVPTAEK